jgi:hypothetical protein
MAQQLLEQVNSKPSKCWVESKHFPGNCWVLLNGRAKLKQEMARPSNCWKIFNSHFSSCKKYSTQGPAIAGIF